MFSLVYIDKHRQEENNTDHEAILRYYDENLG